MIVHHIKPDLRLADFAWDSSSEQSIKPRIVSRGLENFDISEGEPEKIDHLLFLVHGIGEFYLIQFELCSVILDFDCLCQKHTLRQKLIYSNCLVKQIKTI